MPRRNDSAAKLPVWRMQAGKEAAACYKVPLDRLGNNAHWAWAGVATAIKNKARPNNARGHPMTFTEGAPSCDNKDDPDAYQTAV